MRKRKLIARLIKALVIVFVLLASAAAAYFVLSGEIESQNKNLRVADGKKIKNNAEFEELKKEVANSKDAFEFYSNFQTTEDAEDGSFRRGRAVQILSSIKTLLSLNSLSYKWEPFKPVEGNDSTKDSASIVMTTLIIEFKSVDDIRPMRLLREIERRFPGHVYIRKFEMKALKRDIVDQDLLAISEGRGLDLVTGEIEFDWYAIRLKEEIKEGGGDV